MHFMAPGMRDLALETSQTPAQESRKDVNFAGTGTKQLAPSPSPSDLDSGDEVIMFSGRSRKSPGKLGSKSVTNRPMSEAGQDLKFAIQDGSPSTWIGMDNGANACDEPEKWKGRKKLQRKRNQRRAKKTRISEKDEEDAASAEYISNMQSTDGTNDLAMLHHFRFRDLDLDSRTGSLQLSDSGEEAAANIHSQDDWDSADLQDFDCLSSSSEPLTTPSRILRKHMRNSQAQYLVVAKGEPLDEARWVPENLLTAPNASKLIKHFEDSLPKSTHSADEDGVLSDGNSSLETVKDETDLKESDQTRASDEQLARLLSKQAEIGLVGDDLVLFDGSGFDEGPQDSVSTRGIAVASPNASISHGKSNKRSDIRRPLAASYTNDRGLDPYDDFDVMDFERPSLRKKSKRGQLNETLLNLSDPELQQSTIAAWQSDRAAKKQRKLERELLRSRGLIGKNKKPDVGKKLGGEKGTDEIKTAMKDFLRSSEPSRSLPPMDHRERKMIHLIAHKSGLKSHSMGSGAARFPVLYRTNRTKPLTPNLEAQINTLFTPRDSFRRSERSHGKSIPASQNGIGGMYTAASYRDGEIVGVGAPEIGMENKGRAILEKMGWSTGSSLGASNNKGIAQPIEQIVKTSKAGLG